MVKYLYVGDVHVKVSDLPECQRLVDGITGIARKEVVDAILILGDLFHSFSLVRLEVADFWRKTLQRWSDLGIRTIIIPGNHDMAGDGRSAAELNAISSFGYLQNLQIVSTPRQIDGMLMLPHMASAKEFVKVCNTYSQYRTVICHQEFNGCKYENGFYSKEGVDPESIPQQLVISGHIHLNQQFGKVFYVGSPRWMTASDANSDKFLHIIEHEDNGDIRSIKKIPTDTFCRRLVEVDDTPDTPVPERLDPNHEYIINVKGPTDWVNSRKDLWAGRARVRTVNTDAQVAKVRESDGIPVAFSKFFEKFIPPNGTEKTILLGLAEKRLFAQ